MSFETLSGYKQFYDSSAEVISDFCLHIISEENDVPLSITVIIAGVFHSGGQILQRQYIFILRKNAFDYNLSPL